MFFLSNHLLKIANYLDIKVVYRLDYSNLAEKTANSCWKSYKRLVSRAL